MRILYLLIVLQVPTQFLSTPLSHAEYTSSLFSLRAVLCYSWRVCIWLDSLFLSRLFLSLSLTNASHFYRQMYTPCSCCETHFMCTLNLSLLDIIFPKKNTERRKCSFSLRSTKAANCQKYCIRKKLTQKFACCDGAKTYTTFFSLFPSRHLHTHLVIKGKSVSSFFSPFFSGVNESLIHVFHIYKHTHTQRYIYTFLRADILQPKISSCLLILLVRQKAKSWCHDGGFRAFGGVRATDMRSVSMTKATSPTGTFERRTLIFFAVTYSLRVNKLFWAKSVWGGMVAATPNRLSTRARSFTLSLSLDTFRFSDNIICLHLHTIFARSMLLACFTLLCVLCVLSCTRESVCVYVYTQCFLCFGVGNENRRKR